MILGVDIGGTSLKFGIVSPAGGITDYKKIDTNKMVEDGFAESLKKVIKEYLAVYPELKGVGMGYPGLLSADRKEVIFLPNIPKVKDLAIVDILKKEFPKLTIKIENDAKCATLGEYYFGKHKGEDNFMLVTIGTGIGSGAIINDELFIGARGNGMEIGHMLTENGLTLEQQVGLSHLMNYAHKVLSGASSKETKLNKDDLSMEGLCDAATEGDKYAKKVFEYLGSLLGKTLVSVIRVLDINFIMIGGGVSAAFDFMLPSLKSVVKENMPPYYTGTLKIEKASLSNDAGLLGAAALVMHEHKK
jgi:glucokinase